MLPPLCDVLIQMAGFQELSLSSERYLGRLSRLQAPELLFFSPKNLHNVIKSYLICF